MQLYRKFHLPCGGPMSERPCCVLTSDNKTEYYTGIADNNFKERFNGHKTTLNNSDKRNKTTLSQHIWELKDSGKNFNLTWSIVQNAPIFNHTTKKCRLCNIEKLLIMFQPDGATLNDRSELYSTCRHRLKNTLKKVK